MATQQYHNRFEVDPSKHSFHELFAMLVDYRKNVTRISVEKLVRAVDAMSSARYPDVSNALQSSFERVVQKEVPMVNIDHPFDTENMMRDAVEVKEVPDVASAMGGDHYNPVNQGYFTPDPEDVNAVMRDQAYQKLASIADVPRQEHSL